LCLGEKRDDEGEQKENQGRQATLHGHRLKYYMNL
jgi:hypothetical protein